METTVDNRLPKYPVKRFNGSGWKDGKLKAPKALVKNIAEISAGGVHRFQGFHGEGVERGVRLVLVR